MTKPPDIVYDKMVNNIKEVHKNYVTPLSYDCSYAMYTTKYDGPLSLTTGVTML